MAYQYPAMVAWDPNGKTVVKNTVFQVYAPSDTSFASPLAITDNLGNALANLNSGSVGVFPNFQQAQYTTVVVSDTPAHTYAWTVPCSQVNPVTPWAANTYYTSGQAVVNPSGDVVTANVNHTSSGTYDSTKWNYSSTSLRWQPNTSYTAGVVVINPSGISVAATATHTSASTYDSTKWVPTYAPTGDSAQVTAVAHATNITVTASSNWGINAQGNGYHDPSGAASGEGAANGFDANGNLTLTRILAY